MAWKNVTFLSRIKRNREISIQFRVSARGKRCKFLNFLTARMSNHRCSDKIGYKFGSARIIARFRKQGFSRVAQRNLLFLFFTYLSIRLYRSDESREESRRNFQRDWKYLRRENSLLRQRFEDAYSRLASICVLSFRSYLFCWWKHRWKCVENVPKCSSPQFGEIISNVENIGKQFSHRIDANTPASSIFEHIRKVFLSWYIVHIFHITFLSNYSSPGLIVSYTLT